MQNGNMISNFNCIKKRLKRWVDNFIFLVLNAFHHVQTTFKAILSKHDLNEGFKSAAASPSSEYQILTQKNFNRDEVHMTEINLSLEATEKIHTIESDGQNRTRSSIIERSISLEMNKREFMSESGE